MTPLSALFDRMEGADDNARGLIAEVPDRLAEGAGVDRKAYLVPPKAVTP